MSGLREPLIAHVRQWVKRGPKPLPRMVYIEHALVGEAFTARMLSENPNYSPETKRAYEWAEGQFLRIARGDVGERDLIG